MGKNNKYKKKLKSEKAKIHITTKTKFLPKGQNVTNTSFKIKPIIVPEQLKDRNDQGFGKKRSTVELLSKLKHYSDVVKTEACQELKEMVKSQNLESVQQHLTTIIQAVTMLLQGNDRKLRRACISLLREILKKVSYEQLKPFFNYILTNLKCAFTHIKRSIQEDSLLLLDAILEWKSSLIADNFNAFFLDFVTLISKLKNNSSLERTVALHLNSTLSSAKWRVQVLTRLCGILNAVVEHCRNKNKSCDATVPLHIAKNSHLIQLKKSSSVYEFNNMNFLDKGVQLENKEVIQQITVLIPLLHETWLEVAPDKSINKIKSEATFLGDQPAAILTCIVRILRLLYEYNQLYNLKTEHTFPRPEVLKFLNCLLINFPYSYNARSNSEFKKEFAKAFLINFETNCVEENLVIICIYVELVETLNPSKRTKDIIASIACYVNRCLKVQHYVNFTIANYLVRVLKEILLNRPNMWQKMGVDHFEMTENVISFFEKGKSSEKLKNAVLDILIDPRLLCRYEKHQQWLGRLPILLCSDQSSVKLTDVILNLCQEGNAMVQEGVRNCLKPILDNLRMSLEYDASDVDAARYKILNILFYVRGFSQEDLEQIHSFINIHVDSSPSKQLQRILELKTYMQK